VTLRVRLLGGLDVDGVEFSRLGSRKARTMLARLALGRGAPVPADALVDVVWPGADRPQRPNDQLSVLVSRLRSVLGGPALPRQGRGYALVLDWLDVDAVADLVGEARKRLEGGALAPARSAIEAAIALDRGSLLPDEEGDWIDAERAAAARTGVLARTTAAEVALAGGDPWTAAQAAQAALDLDRYDEGALRLLMSALAASGRSAQAISAYLDFQSVIREELGVDPDPATTASYVELLRVERAAPAMPVRPARAGLVGRAAEVHHLDEALAEARGGRVVLVAVYGEAGIGKTRLLDFWAEGRTDATVLRAAGSELGGDLPLQPLLDAVALWLRRNPHQEHELLGGAAQALAPLVGAGTVDDPGIGRVIALFGDARAAGPSVLFAALDTVVGRLASTGPVMLLIDDGHWLDSATLGWLRHAQVRLADLPVLVVIALRPGEGSPPSGTDTIHMGPLDLAAVTELVGSPRAARLHERSGGHPLFLMELMHASGEDDLPASIRDAVVERCEQTGPAAATLRTAAVLGPEVDLDLVSAVLGAPPTVLLDHLEEGVRRHLLVEDGRGFRFRHQLIREALCLATGPGRTALLHRTAGQSLRARGRRADPLDVAHHARLGGDLTLAAHALADAGDLAAARYDHDEALRLFDAALSADDVPELRLRRARAALAAGRHEEAAADAGAALAGGVGAEGMEVAAIAAYLARDFRRCRRLAEDGARLAGDAVLRASCLSLAGRVCHVDGDLAAADLALAAARETAPPEVRPLAQLWTAPLWTDRGDPSAALDLLGEAASAFVARHPFVEPHRHLAAAQALGMLGRADEALAELAQVDRTAAEQRTERFTARADNCRAWILRNVGAFDEADARNEAAYARSAGETVWIEPVADALLGLADGRLRAGEPGAARVLLDRYLTEAAAPHSFAWRHMLRATLLRGWCSLAEGDVAAALAAAADVVAEAEALVVPRYAVLGRAVGAAARGEPLDGAQVRRYAPLEAGWLTAMADRHEQR
jgi:DNA-binding SARP family transcriptional activator/tetratricopeptide (TPR) repeat protein